MEFEHTFGCVPSPIDERDYKAKDHIAMGVRPKKHYPATLAPILNQGAVGSCVAHTLATLKWYQERRERKGAMQFSTDFIYHNRSATDWQGEGMIPREAIAHIVDDGALQRCFMPTNTKYPDYSVKVLAEVMKGAAKDYKALKYICCADMDDICEAIFQYGAALVCVNVTTSFNGFYMRNEANMTLPIPADNEHNYGNHAVCAIGYDEKGIIIQNSWGDTWGYKGLARMPYNYIVTEAWAVIDEVKDWDIVELPIGANKAVVNGLEKDLDVPAQIVDGRTMVPIRFVAEALGADVEWLEDERKVVIRKAKKG